MSFKRAAWILALVVGLSLLHLSLHTRNMKLKYEVEDLKRVTASLRTELRELKLSASRKKELGRIENLAKRKLHMVRPDSIKYIKLGSGEAD